LCVDQKNEQAVNEYLYNRVMITLDGFFFINSWGKLFKRLKYYSIVFVLTIAYSSSASSAIITIFKAERRIEYKHDNLTLVFPVGLGTAPIGKKLARGDRKTPEGKYFVTHKNAESHFYLSLGISYPNLEDAKSGLNTGIISRDVYASIEKSLSKGRLPVQNTKLGGDIFIHGGGAQTDWTWGCIALNNVDMKVLFEAVNVGDTVIIRK
jgi:murein L,D-transpeptidase YafK